MQLVQTFGLAVVCLASLGYAIWQTLSWVAEHVIRPVISKHLEFLSKMERAIEQQTQASQDLANCLERLTEDMVEVRSIIVRPDKVEITTQQRGSGAHSGGN